MVIEILNRNLKLEADTCEWIERRLHFALGRFSNRIRKVSVSLTDLNGPRGGIDKDCTLRILLKPMGEIVLDDVDETVEGAVAMLAERASRAITRRLEKRGDGRSGISASGMSTTRA